MDTLTFLKTILPEEGIYYLALFRDGQKFPAHRSYSDLETLAHAIDGMAKQSEVSVYHACATYQLPFIEVEQDDGTTKKKYRVPDNWNRAKAFWLDIDCGEAKAAKGVGYPTKIDAVKAVFKFAAQIGWPKPLIVDSGNGIHAYWPLTKAIRPEPWRRVANTLKAATQHFGLLADPTRTADFSSILRPAGSINRKNGDAKPVVVKNQCEASDPATLAQALNKVAKEFKLPAPVERTKPTPLPGINDDLTSHLESWPQLESSARKIAGHCQQVRQMAESKGDVSYEHWRGVIGLIKHCNEGVELAHEWSENREATGHAQCDVRARYDTWSAGPTTCEFFERNNAEGCDGCVHKGKIKSPIVLGRVIPITEEKVVEAVSVDTGEVEQVTIPALPYGYQWDKGLMSRILINKDGIPEPHPFCNNLFYPTMRIRKEDGTFNIGIRMHLPDGRVREFEIPFEAMASTTDLLRSFAKYELIQSNHKDAGQHMHAYLRDSMEELKRKVEEVNTLTTFGWKYDMQAFLIGDRLYHKDGSVRRVLLGGYAAAKRNVFAAPKGTVAGYAKPLNFIYHRKGLEPLQYALCSGWGSILAPFCEDLYKGLMFSLYSGRSGTGKSTVCYNSLYAFGDAEAMAMKSEDMGTKNAVYATMGTFNNIPMLFDELTKIDPADLSSMAYYVSLGQERVRMTSRGGSVGFANTATWRMSPFVTSNKDLHAILSMTVANAEAESVRVVQINLDRYNIPVLKGADLQAFQMACDQIKMNAGAAGDAMIRYVVTNVDSLYERMRRKVMELAEHIPEPKFRFYRSHAACTLVMAEIAKELGIIEFDVPTLHTFAVELMLDLRSSVAEATATTPEDAFSRMLNAFHNRIIVTQEYRDNRSGLGPESPKRPINGEVIGRLVSGSPGKKDDPMRGRLMLSAKEVRDWCTKNRVDYRRITEYLQSHGALVAEHERVRLTRGTDVPGGQTWCMVIDTLKLESADNVTPMQPTVVVDNTRSVELVANAV
jgi:hypothetical protein